MSFRKLVTAIILSVSALSGAQAQDQVLKVGSTPTGIPFTFLDTKTNTIEGVMVDLIKAIGKDAGFKVEIEGMQFSTLIPSLTSNKIDIIAAAMFITFKPWSERTGRAGLSQPEILQKIEQESRQVREALVFVLPPPAIEGLGVAGGFQMQVEDRGGMDLKELQKLIDEMVKDGNSQSGLMGLQSGFRAGVPMIHAEVDRVKAKSLGVSLDAIFGTQPPTDVAKGNEIGAKSTGLNVVLTEGYSATAPDLSALVTRLKRARPDVILHTGYNPDITLFLRQARENGLRFKMLFGAGAGYSQLDKLRATFGTDIDNFCNIDPVLAQLLDPAKLAPGLGDLIKTMVERFKAKTGATEVPPHCSMGFNQTWVLLNNVLPVAKEKYGSFDPEAVRKAALDVDIPPGGTIQGYGVKFYPPDTPMSGQNERSTPVVMQNAGEHISVVWPTNIRTPDPVFPLPKSSIYAA